MNSFIGLYSRSFNENVSEKNILNMKHALSISVVNDVKFVMITPLMKMLAKLVTLMENRLPMSVCQLKDLLGFSQMFLFELGNYFFCHIILY